MMRHRLAAILLTAAPLALLAAPPAQSIEVAAYTPDPSLLPVRQPVEAPLRVAEALSVEAVVTLAPAADGAVSDLAALAAWNENPRNPTRVGFARALAVPLDLRYDEAGFAARVGRRAGGGFVARRSTGSWVWGTSVEVSAAKALRLELADVDLPAGTRFWVYSMGGEPRAFDLRLLRSDGTLISPTIDGDRIYLEVELPYGSVAAGQGFRIRRVHELVTSFGPESADVRVPEADGCLQNGECFDTADFPGITNARKGVFQYVFEDAGFLYTCSGGLLDDNDPSTLEPWFLTAHHCVGNQASAISMDTVFIFRMPTAAARVLPGSTARSAQISW